MQYNIILATLAFKDAHQTTLVYVVVKSPNFNSFKPFLLGCSITIDHVIP